jgi:antitoxin component YwqK of YwqJK toxin-antitoxin module
VNGYLHGEWIQWYEKGGFVDTKGQYSKGHQQGEWTYYFETGGVSRVQNFNEGRLSGKSTSYFQDGRVQSESAYVVITDKRKGKPQSVPDGTWVFYDKNGNVINRIVYSNGERKN